MFQEKNKKEARGEPDALARRMPQARSRVVISRCASYDRRDLSLALRRIFDSLGGLSSVVKQGSRVFVKINHLSPSSPPERAILTHPSFTREVLQLLSDSGAELTVGDDIYSRHPDGFSLSGYRAVCDELGVRLVNLKETGFVEVAVHGKVLKKTYIARPVVDADVIINLPKLKTHSFAIFTGAIKNMYGVIPHGLRLAYHRRYVRNDVFSQMLVDLFSCVPPQLNIMDAVVGMEGEGPSAGKPKKVGLILASRDAVALDAAAARVIGYGSSAIYTTVFADERSLGTADFRKIEVAGERLEDVVVSDFRHSAVAVSFFKRWLPSVLYAYIQNQLTLIPEIRRVACEACLECVSICPPRAISLLDDAACIDESNCIHCLCCHEICQYQAIKLKQLPLGRLLRKGDAVFKKASAILNKRT
ncbi:MAG: DUF362 domain-containing protein [Clostridiales bacterium]|nr:DUF362 domain-containing protein [Clostridiales bacterium]